MPVTSKKSLQDVDTLISQLSGLTGLSEDQVSDQISSLKIPSFQFNDAILVSPEDFEQVIDAWALNIKTSLRKVEAPTRVTSAASKEAEDVVDLRDRPQSPTINLQWPKGYEDIVTHLYSQTFSRVLPIDSAQQRLYLEAIAQETETGQKLVDELATAIVKRAKRKLSKEKVLEGLKQKASKMLSKIK